MARRWLRLAAAALFALTVLTGAPARASANQIVAGPGSQALRSYATPIVIAAKVAPLTFRNQDVQPHSVVSVAVGPSDRSWCRFFPEDACPLLWTPVTDAGGRTNDVRGLDGAVTGAAYEFYCVVHPLMRGTAVVA